MTKVEAILFWVSAWFYGVSFVFYLAGTVFSKNKVVTIGLRLAIAAIVFQTMCIITRWVAVGHPPVMGVYENSMLGSWFIGIIFLMLVYWQDRINLLGVAVIPILLLMAGNGVMTDVEHIPLSPPYKSNWLWLHIFFAWVAYAAFCAGAGLGLLYVLKERAEIMGKRLILSEKLPELELMCELTLKVIIFGFVALTVEIGAGGLWAYDLWGRYWGWDPIETWSLITWLTYGLFIHLGATMGWKGRRMAWLAIGAIIFVFITFGGIGFIGGIHTPIM